MLDNEGAFRIDDDVRMVRQGNCLRHGEDSLRKRERGGWVGTYSERKVTSRNCRRSRNGRGHGSSSADADVVGGVLTQIWVNLCGREVLLAFTTGRLDGMIGKQTCARLRSQPIVSLVGDVRNGK